MDESHADGVKPDLIKSTMLADMATFILWKRIRREHGITLKHTDVDRLINEIDLIPLGHGMLWMLDTAAERLDGQPSSLLSRLLTQKDTADEPFADVHAARAEHDADCLALGLYARLECAAYGYEPAGERKAMRLRMAQADGNEYAVGILYAVLQDIHDMLLHRQEALRESTPRKEHDSKS